MTNKQAERQVVLDTETTGLNVNKGDRIIEVGCIEVMHRRITERYFHRYVNPGCHVSAGAQAVHGIGDEFLKDKPSFAAIAEQLLDFIHGAELIIHNAPFDTRFLNYELSLLGTHRITDYATVVDTLPLARRMHPGQKNNLDALCKRYGVDGSERQQHGALLDASLLAKVYLAMTSGQQTLTLSTAGKKENPVGAIKRNGQALPVICADEAELAAHDAYFSTEES